MQRKYVAHNSLMPFYLAWQIDPSNSNYNLTFSYRLNNMQSADLVVEKLQKLIKSKAYLRQTFILENDLLMACIHDELPAEIYFFTSSSVEFSKLEQELIAKPHDINLKSAIQLNIVRFTDNNACLVLFNIHHILMDGFSLSNFIMELNRLMAGESIDSESAEGYISKVLHENPLQEKDVSLEFEEYIREINEISTEISYPIGEKKSILFYSSILPSKISKKLVNLSQESQISVYNLLLLAWSSFTAKLFNQEVALINYPVNIRTDKSIFGCFVNMITLPLRFSAEDTFFSLMTSWTHKIGILKQVSRFKPVNHIDIDTIPSFTYSNTAQLEDLIIHNKQYPAKVYPQIANSNLNLKFREKNGEFYFSCEIFSELFPEYFSYSLLVRFFNFVNKLLINPSELLSSFELTFDEEKKKILYDFNNTDIFYPIDKTLVDLFEEIAIQYPNKIAATACNGKITYHELNEKSQKLAAFLMAKGVLSKDIIGILIDNRLEMIIAIIAVLKSGAAYLPIAYTTPVDKIEYVLTESKSKYLLTLPEFITKLELDILVIDINQENSNKTYIKQKIVPDDIACVVFTSGTTGKAKGVLLEHKALINIILGYLKNFEINNCTNCSKYAEFGFDASLIEIFPALLSGATLHIIPDQDRKDVNKVRKFFLDFQINFGFLPTSFAELFLGFESYYLKYLLIAGEKFNKFKKSSFKIVNAYGTTETSVHATHFFVDKQYINTPIGKPTNNVKCYVVDNNFNILPIGLIGELIVGGESLARGYLNQENLNNEKFIKNPFQTKEEAIKEKNARLYKTGDLVRWLPDGNLEYIGRSDLQVKIMGCRVDLREIEDILMQYSGIENAVVILKKRFSDEELSDKYLAAFYSSKVKLDESKIRDYLISMLPTYMAPNVLIYLKDKFPLTANGKVDRNVLAKTKFSDINYDVESENNQKERMICDTFSQVLGLKRVGVNDDFFCLGGTSLTAISLVMNLQSNFNISLIDVFNLRTPKKIASHISFVKNYLRIRLEQIKNIYLKRRDFLLKNREMQDLKFYINSVKRLKISDERKPLRNILLTGSTGFLGCNLLDQLLKLTNYHIFVLVRARSNTEAYNRLDKKFQLYFQRNLAEYPNRLTIFTSDIEKAELGLSKADYHKLVVQVDSIIHCAALTKHYEEYDKLYTANVQATINMLELSKLTRLKDFHYISTLSVFEQDFRSLEDNKNIFLENDINDCYSEEANVYIKTKSQGEEKVIEYRQQGVISNIYRVGNLAFILKNGQVQENDEDNSFLNRLKCLSIFKTVAEEINTEQISPVDLTAQAILKLFDKKLSNQIYHVFNPYLSNIAEDFLEGIVKIVSMNQFIDKLIEFLDNSMYKTFLGKFLLYQGWLNRLLFYTPQIRQDKTLYILKQLSFEWTPIKKMSKILSDRTHLMEMLDDSKVENFR